MDKYQTIGARFGAIIIDSIILIPISLSLTAGFTFYSNGNQILTLSAQILGSLIGVIYYVFLHGKYGKTLGKRVFNVKVLDLSENEITYQHAIIRHSPQIIQLIATVLLLASFTSGGEVNKFYLQYGYNGILILITIWSLADIIVALSTEKHRALHDYIAGTVVIKT